MKLSHKLQSALYRSVSDDIMDARIAIAKVKLPKDAYELVDKILFDLSIKAPDSAVKSVTK